MGAFGVFGWSMGDCIKRAEKKMHLPNFINVFDYYDELKGIAAELYKNKGKPKLISPTFDALQFANEYAKLAKNTDGFEVHCVMVKTTYKVKVQAKDGAIKERKKTVWEPWQDA